MRKKKKEFNILRTVFRILVVLVISVGIVGILNIQYIEQAQKPVLEITPDTYSVEVKRLIQKGDVVQILGTPDLMLQVSQEPVNPEATVDDIIYHYAGLKEYGFDFVVRIKRGKLESSEQVFRGKVIGINETNFEGRIRTALNREINFDDSVNRDISAEIDQSSKDQIRAKSVGSFTSSTLMILDEDELKLDQIYNNMVWHTTLLSLLLLAIFKKNIF